MSRLYDEEGREVSEPREPEGRDAPGRCPECGAQDFAHTVSCPVVRDPTPASWGEWFAVVRDALHSAAASDALQAITKIHAEFVMRGQQRGSSQAGSAPATEDRCPFCGAAAPSYECDRCHNRSHWLGSSEQQARIVGAGSAGSPAPLLHATELGFVAGAMWRDGASIPPNATRMPHITMRAYAKQYVEQNRAAIESLLRGAASPSSGEAP